MSVTESGSHRYFNAPYDTVNYFSNIPSSFGAFNVVPGITFSYDLKMSEKMGLSFGAYSGIGLIDQREGPSTVRIAHYGVQLEVYRILPKSLLIK